MNELTKFGCKVTGKQTPKWTRLRRESIANWPLDYEPDAEQLAGEFTKHIEKLAKELAGVPDALRPIFQDGKTRIQKNSSAIG